MNSIICMDSTIIISMQMTFKYAYVCIRIYMFMYVCMHVCIHTHIHTHANQVILIIAYYVPDTMLLLTIQRQKRNNSCPQGVHILLGETTWTATILYKIYSPKYKITERRKETSKWQNGGREKSKASSTVY